jgi:hypothetical protein
VYIYYFFSLIFSFFGFKKIEKSEIDYLKNYNDEKYIKKLKLDLDDAIKKGNLILAQQYTIELTEISKLKNKKI